MIIRAATKTDITPILQLVKKLAIYERKNPEDVHLTIEKLESHSFGKKNILTYSLPKKRRPLSAIFLFFYLCCLIGRAHSLY